MSIEPPMRHKHHHSHQLLGNTKLLALMWRISTAPKIKHLDRPSKRVEQQHCRDGKEAEGGESINAEWIVCPKAPASGSASVGALFLATEFHKLA
jgi:hypothetical protein